MSLFTVQIGSDPAIEVYAGTSYVDQYINAMIGTGAAAYRNLTAGGDDRKRLLVAITRWIDSHAWAGVADAFGGTTLQFPRTGLLLSDGVTAATDAYQLTVVSQAVAEMVAIAAADPTALTALDAGNSVQSFSTGQGSMTFFAGTSARSGTATLLPLPVNRLLGQWLAANDTSVQTAASGGSGGVNTCSDFDPDDGDDDDDVLDVTEPL